MWYTESELRVQICHRWGKSLSQAAKSKVLHCKSRMLAFHWVNKLSSHDSSSLQG